VIYIVDIPLARKLTSRYNYVVYHV